MESSSNLLIRKPKLKRLWGYTAVWLVIMLMRAIFHFDLEDKLWGIILLVDLGLALCGLTLLGVGMFYLVRYKTFRSSTLLTLLVGGWMMLAHFTPMYPMVSGYTKLWIMEAEYKQIVMEVKASGAKDIYKGGYQVSKDGKQVFFYWMGMLDNAAGVVHDADGDILKFVEKDSGLIMFDGVVREVRHMWGPWYYLTLT